MRASPWKLGGLSLRELAGRVWREINEDEVVDRAAGLSYYFLFALFPMLLFLTALFGFFLVPNVMDQLLGYINRVLPGDAASLLSKTFTGIATGTTGGLLSFGALAALWASSNGMVSIMTALNVAFDVVDERPWWRRRLTAIGLTFGFALFTLTALVLLVFGERIGSMMANWLSLGWLFVFLWNLGRWIVVIVCVLAGVNLVYFLAPARKERWWRLVTPGALFAVIGWLVMSYVLRLYVQYFANYNATYGSIGGVILLMLWLYLSGVVLLIGAEINSEIEHAAVRGPDAPPLPPRAVTTRS